MTGRGIRFLVAAAVVAGIMADVPAGSARERPYDFFDEGDLFAPPDVGQPNADGCVKICLADKSPCDSFSTKQVDGRCKRGA